jgi:hypothetical protein
VEFTPSAAKAFDFPLINASSTLGPDQWFSHCKWSHRSHLLCLSD